MKPKIENGKLLLKLRHNPTISSKDKTYIKCYLMNENEVITPEEYFYRPALGEFAPSPTTGRFALNENGRNYFDKFGRIFMRTIHVLRVEGIDEASLSNIFNEELKVIHNTEPHPKSPEKYKDFNF